jgi:metallo-beta-lactamase family protein
MQSIDFLGAAGGEVTGSSYLVTATDGGQVLVDFGMFQGKADILSRNHELLTFNPSDLQAVFVTHAHLDHCGRLPLLYYGNFHAKIYMTAPTKAFVELILMDSARIGEKDTVNGPLYTKDVVKKILRQIQVVSYDKEVRTSSFRATFTDAGHILGSASILVTDTSSEKPDSVVFSGDLGNTPQAIVKPTTYIAQADYVVMESTYGGSTHPQDDPFLSIMEEINRVEESGGVLLIPAFALERTQELLHIINHLKADGKIKAETPIYLDSPMAIEATLTYLQNTQLYNEEMLSHESIPFNFEGIVITSDSRDSIKIHNAPNPKVIIAGSGMMSGGRIMHHAYNYLSQESTRLLLVGYQAEETLGYQIQEGAKDVIIDGTHITVRAHIRVVKTLSSHADQPRLLTWLSHINGVKKVFLTHGEDEQQHALKQTIINELQLPDTIIPTHLEHITLSNE